MAGTGTVGTGVLFLALNPMENTVVKPELWVKVTRREHYQTNRLPCGNNHVVISG
jgi:hypothetical protein